MASDDKIKCKNKGHASLNYEYRKMFGMNLHARRTRDVSP